MEEHQVLKRERMEQKKKGGEAVKNYPHTCVFVEGRETKA
jgi:hypothetical protein